MDKRKQDVLQAKILHVELRPSLKSYIENKRGLKTEPCGTPDFIASQKKL